MVEAAHAQLGSNKQSYPVYNLSLLSAKLNSSVFCISLLPLYHCKGISLYLSNVPLVSKDNN